MTGVQTCALPICKTTALVGHSWSGKSTIIKLLLRLHDIDDGNIYIDNQNIHDIDISTLYDHIWYLTQEPAIFDWTIRENLMYGLADTFDIKSSENSELPDISKNSNIHKDSKSDHASNIYINQNNSLTSQKSVPNISNPSNPSEYSLKLDEILRNGLKLAKADELVAWLKDGLDTEIWEKWIKLSGGEKQRIAIARIFVKNPQILILDEPTSALDSISEHAITQAIQILMYGKTVVIIAHRLQTVMHADNIYVMQAGKIIESWTHDYLINQSWTYRELVDLQSGLIKE